MAKECMLSAGKLPLGGLPRNSVVRITDCPDGPNLFIMDKAPIKQTKQKTLPNTYLITVKFLNFRTPENFAVIFLKFILKTQT